MRSSVSVILSSPVPDPNMSQPDYEQTALHHASLLILVKQLGDDLSQKQFTKLFERISKVNNIKVCDSNGVNREIFARYIKHYPVANNDWGDFQTHRRILGLITVGKCKTQCGLNDICRGHESLKVKYSGTLYDSRCILFGVNDGEEVPHFQTMPEFKSRALFYAAEGEESSMMESSLAEFLSSLFWVLESKRQERCREKIERVSLLLAPFERKDFVGLDMESRSNKKRSVGRMAKQLGDLCLQAGLHSDALTHYHAAVDTLRSVNDWLWLASACEGLSAASVCVRYPKMNKVSTIHRNSSLQEGNMKNRPVMSTSKNLELLEPMSLPHQLPPTNVLSPEEICKMYKEAIVHYCKYQNASVIETEMCFKAARVAIELNLVLQAASFLQNIIFINLVLPEDQKIEKLMTLSELYGKLGFQRKASFYRRLAASRYVSARNPQTDWERCYTLMLQALPGHKLTLDPADYSPYGGVGWGGLQKQVLQDVAGAARRAGLVALATRHMTLLLQVMWKDLSPGERQEAALQLQSVASQCEGSPVSLILDSGLVIPPANLIHIPTTQSFVVQKLKPHLQPTKLEQMKEDYGPFVFTPLKFGSLERKAAKDSKLNYLWVADEYCHVVIELSNPLRFELEVSNMRLLTSGVVFESLPLTVTLPPEVSSYPVTLTGTPREVGELEITGYSTHTLGVKSNCRLKSLPNQSQSSYVLEVVPSLPLIALSLKIPEFCNINKDPNSNRTNISLFAGESINCWLEVENIGKGEVEVMELSVETRGDFPSHSHVLSYDANLLDSYLPLAENAVVTLPLTVFAAANFVNAFPNDDASVRSSVFSTMSGPQSYPSLSSYKQGIYDHLSPTASLKSGPSSLNSLSSQFTKMNIDNTSKSIECKIKLKYSGPPGLKDGYCRTATAVLKIEVQSSIVITNWDVMPADTSSQFYMVLDVTNMTNQEVELKYTSTKCILIEENESCRVPIPVDRCPLSKIGKYFQSEESIKEIVDLNQACSEHIASQVEVCWEAGDRKGVASLHGLTLSSNIMLDIVRMSPISWEVLLDGERVEENTVAASSTVGECLQVCVTALNSLPTHLSDVVLSVHFFQDYQNGTCNFMMDTRLAIAGLSQLSLPKVEENGQAKYELSVVFFCPGLYKMNVQCTSQRKHTWRLLPPIEVEVKLPPGKPSCPSCC